MGLGLYFIFIRPDLLPEDPRFMAQPLLRFRLPYPA
jgi:hypothetical protein